MPSKLVEDKRRYLYAVYVGSSEGNFIQRLVYTVRRMWWTGKINRMSEGEILKRYYELTRKEDPDDYIISKALRSIDR